MPKNNSSINNSLFDLLKGKGYSPTMLSTAGKEIPTPDEAEVFQFNFVKDGEDYGKVTLTIDDASNLIVYYSDDVADSEKEASGSGDLSWYGLLNQLKRFAQRYQLSFELRNTDNLKSDMAKRDYMKKQDQISESKHHSVAEGYSLKKTNVEKTFHPGDPDEYTQDVNTTDTDYEIINNKTGQVVGTASWTTNDFMGPGALKITMKNGATRWLDIWDSEKGNPQTAFNRFVKDPKTAKKYKEQDIKGVTEMDKSQTPSGRDGRVSHRTYGSRDTSGDTGAERTAKPITAKQATTDAMGILNKQLKKKDVKEMDNRTPSGDRREQRANSPEEKAKREKEQQKRLKQVSPEMRKKLRLPDPDKEDMAEGTESVLTRGTEVTVPHRGKMVPGKILRYVAGKGGYSDAYVVDIGEYESLTVPTFNVKTQGMSEGIWDNIKGAAKEFTRDSTQKMVKQAWENTFWPKYVEPAMKRISIDGRPLHDMVLGEPRIVENDRSKRTLFNQYTIDLVFPIDSTDWKSDQIYELTGQLHKLESESWNPNTRADGKGFKLINFMTPYLSYEYSGKKQDLVIPVSISSVTINPNLKREQDMSEASGDQVKKVFKKNGKPVGEVGIDPEASPGVGQWYMKCYQYKIDNSGYDSYEEAVEELKYCMKQGVAEGLGKDIKRLATGKDVKSRAGQEIAKAQDANMKGDTKTSKKHFDRFDKLDKLANKEQGVAEGTEDSTQVLSDIVANGDFDALYDLMSSNTEAGKIVQRMYNDVAGEEGLHPDDDFEEILNRVFDHLSQVYGQQDMAEGSGDKVHLKTPKHGLADHPGRNSGVGLRTFSQTPEQDRCTKCNTLYKNHYKQGMAEGWNKGRRAVDVDRDDNKGPDDSLDQLIDLQGQRDWFAKMSKPKNMRNDRQKAAKDAIKRLPVAEEATKKLSKGAKVYHTLHGTGTVVDFSTGPSASHWVDVKFIKDGNKGKITRVDRKQLKLEKVESIAEEIEMKKIIGYKVIDTEGKEVIGKNGKVLIIPIRNYEIDGRYYELQGYEFEPVWSQPTQDMAEGAQQLSVQQLATISDEALDNAYHYGRSSPGNTFGWQANLKSAEFAKRMIDAGITDIEKISDAIHKGWNVTAKAFVENPEQFDDTEKLKAAGKLEAKLQQRAKLMNIGYSQLPDEEQEKDRVVARALLQALTGQQDMAEGSEKEKPIKKSDWFNPTDSRSPEKQRAAYLTDLAYKKKKREEEKLANKEQDMAESNQPVNEGYYPMGKQGSYSDAVPTTKIIIQHSRRIEEGEQRYRNIAKIFVENSEGERFAVPTKKPGLARVYARHIAEGGTPYDERGRHITSLVEEYSKMSGFMRATRGKQFNESAQQLVTEAVNYYQSLRESLSKMTGHRGYSAYFESWTPALMEDGEEQETNLNELFVQETLDPRIESVMPILGKLQRKLGTIKEVDALAEWADNIIEGDGGQEALNPIGIPEATDVTDDNPKSQGGTRAELLRKYANTKKPKDAEAARRAGASQSELKTAADSTEEIHEMDRRDALKGMLGVAAGGLGGYGGYKYLKWNAEKEKEFSTYITDPKDLEHYNKLRRRYYATLTASLAVTAVELAVSDKHRSDNDEVEMAASELNHFRKKLVKKYNIPTDFLGNVKKSDKEGTFEESVNEGASSHDLQNAILYRVEMRHPELFSKYGLEYVADKALDVASFYAGAEEIGSSDMSAMVNHLVKTLEHEGEHGLDENLDANQIHAGQLGPTEKVGPRGAVGKLVGANESVNESEDELARILQMVKHKR